MIKDCKKCLLYTLGLCIKSEEISLNDCYISPCSKEDYISKDIDDICNECYY